MKIYKTNPMNKLYKFNMQIDNLLQITIVNKLVNKTLTHKTNRRVYQVFSMLSIFLVLQIKKIKKMKGLKIINNNKIVLIV